MIDCCVASAVAEFEVMSSSSSIAVTAVVFEIVKFDPTSTAPSTCNPSLITTEEESDDTITFVVTVPIVSADPESTSVPFTL